MDKHFNIADLIFKYIKGIILATEETELQKWLNQSVENQDFFLDLLLSKSFQDKQKIYRRFDYYYNYKALQKQIRPKRTLFLRYIAAAIVILILSIGGVLYWHNQSRPSLPLLTETIPLLPGKPTATLILSNGEEKKLDEHHFELKIKDHQIINQQNRLIYENQESTPLDTTEIYHEIKVPRGGEYQVTLSDGTEVWLNAESSIRYPIEFKRNQRKVWIQGEFYFQVAQDSTRPFIVYHQNLAIQVLGTEFNIRAYADEPNIQTTLVKGKVEISTQHGVKHVLLPSQQLIYSTLDKTYTLQKVNPEQYISWKDGLYIFKTQRLEDIMNLIARWYNVTISYQHQTIKDITFSGRLKRYEQAQTLLEIFEKLGEIQFKIIGNHIIVGKKNE